MNFFTYIHREMIANEIIPDGIRTSFSGSGDDISMSSMSNCRLRGEARLRFSLFTFSSAKLVEEQIEAWRSKMKQSDDMEKELVSYE